MMFNDTTNNTGLIQYYELKTNQGLGTVSGTTAKLQEATLYMNNGLSKIWSSIFNTTGNWIYDDSNYTDLPQATATLTSGQSTYALPSSALTVKRLEVKSETGDYKPLKPISLEEINWSVDEFFEDNAEPQYYRLVDNTIELFPASNYSIAAGIKIYFDRSSVSFDSGDTTEAPGFASEFHYLVALWATYEWKSVHIPNEAKIDFDTFTLGVQDLEKFYGKRYKDKKPRITRAKTNFR